VEILWTSRANPVENPTDKKFLRGDRAGTAAVGDLAHAFAITFA
jgi:hypothetical protein